MRKTIAAVSCSLGLLLSSGAHSTLVFLPDRVIDTNTQLMWLNVWEGDALVYPHRLADVAGGWRHATASQITGFFFGQFGIPSPPFPSMPAPFQQSVVDLILHLGGRGRAVNGYTIGGWFRSDAFPQPGPAFDEIMLDYLPDPSGSGLWHATAIGTIGYWTSLDDHPHPITFPQPHFLVAPAIPEPPAVVMIAMGLLLVGVRVGKRVGLVKSRRTPCEPYKLRGDDGGVRGLVRSIARRLPQPPLSSAQ